MTSFLKVQDRMKIKDEKDYSMILINYLEK
jgi:hypothetical protein